MTIVPLSVATPEVIENPPNREPIGEEGERLHLLTAASAGERVHLVDPGDEACPAG